jgi:annexin A7/11
VSREAEALRKAMKGFGSNDAELIRVLAKADPLQVAAIRKTYDSRFMRSLLDDIAKETSGSLEQGLVAVVRGPLEHDVRLLRLATEGAGTKEYVLNDILLNRSNADINAIKEAYQRTYNVSLLSELKRDLSGDYERLFDFVLAAQRAEDSAPVIPQQIDAEVAEIHRATEGVKLGADAVTVCQLLSSRSDAQLRAISQAYQARYRQPLETVLKKEFHGDLEKALLLILARANDRAKSDAEQLEETMKGIGTKDALLMDRVVRMHWDRAHMDRVEQAYQRTYQKDLSKEIKDETRGNQEKLLLALIK